MISVEYTVTDSNKRIYDFAFDYLNKKYVKVSSKNITTGVVTNCTYGVHYVIVDKTVELLQSVGAVGDVLRIVRETPTSEQIVSWNDASILKASDMSLAQLQQLHILEEYGEHISTSSLTLDVNGQYDAKNSRIVNLVAPHTATDAVNRGYIDSFIGTLTDAQTSATLAQSWAVGSSSSRPEGSAKYWSEQSKNYAEDYNGFMQNALLESTGYGIIRGGNVTVSNMTATVNELVAHMPDGKRYERAQTTITIQTADATNPRIDLIYLSDAGVVTYLAGTASSTPTVPPLPSGGLSLATISVPANAVAGTTTDTRSFKPRYQNTGIVSVKDFGAVCDGVTDDTAIIQTVINQFKYRNIIVLIPENCLYTSYSRYTVPVIDLTKKKFELDSVVAKETSPFYSEIETVQGVFTNSTNGTTKYYLTTIPRLDSAGNKIKLKIGIAYDNPLFTPTGTDVGGEYTTGFEQPSNFSKRHNCSVCINGGVSSYTFPVGPLIVDGTIIPTSSPSNPALGIRDDGSLVGFAAGVTATTIKADGCNNALMGNEIVISNGIIVTTDTNLNPYNVIAQNSSGDYIIFTCEGRNNGGVGMTPVEIANFLLSHDNTITFAYRLDGGGSTSTVVNNLKINNSYDNNRTTERRVATMLYVSKNGTNNIDLAKAYAEIEKLKQTVQYNNIFPDGYASRGELRTPLTRITSLSQALHAGLYFMDGYININGANKYVYGLLINSLLTVDGEVKNGIQVMVDRQSSPPQILYSTVNSAGVRSDWSSTTCPASTTVGRPTLRVIGMNVFDTTLGKPIWWDGTVWKDATGTTV